MVCDDELVKQCLSGDEHAFRRIIDKYKAYVFAIILNFVKDHNEVENIAQETFLQIYRSLPQYRFESLKSWIGKIATTKAIDWKRSNAKRFCEETVVDIESMSNEGNKEYKTPEEIFIQKENKNRIDKICKNIPEIYSNVIIKFYFEGKSYQEIASETGTSLKTIESRLYRGRHLFKEKWREDR
ncbi:RNA polymerase sigma factor [Marinisporobacter balticus]|uniref:RNA polymerase sigma factor (Sigma-70 family) n=1 Tax=Marinisporobacter balticus TaxID=2018667 RepID=A0A4R2KLZ2_9FIRM|nr:sigma-70 family RNA polymerase sigma factor [Marinisporobacter balticus]TCO71048.1 RNA polymerase sigma factor (sigma-70 family) [Marinisporobacter balticus]